MLQPSPTETVSTTPTPVPELRFPIELDSGVVELTLSEIRRRATIEPERIGKNEQRCPVCRRTFNASGFGPHLQSHLRAIGDLPPRKRGPNKATLERRERERAAQRAERKATPTPEPVTAAAERVVLDVDDACIGLLLGLTGADSIGLEQIPAVMRWVRDTSTLVDSLSVK